MADVELVGCSFCGKWHTEVRLMIKGPLNTNICCECVELCMDIVKSKDVGEKQYKTLLEMF